MKRLFWVAVGAGATVAALRKAREVTDKHVPAGARAALGTVAGLTTTAQRVRAEFSAGMAEREAQLRADLLAGADLTRSRATVDAGRAARAAARADDVPGGPGDEVGEGSRPGSAAAAGTAGPGARTTGARGTGARGTGAHRAEDPDDGPAGYSFF